MTALSVIIPAAADETLWRRLLPALSLKEGDEIIIAAAADAPADWAAIKPAAARWLACARRGRAAQMNIAAGEAKNEVLWFVHADSMPPPHAAALLRAAYARAPAAVHYFDLRFYDGGAKMRLNEWGARWRCRLFKNPFGDQALAAGRDLFFAAGGFPEDAPYGEDHLWVLAAAKRGAPVLRVGAAVGTSARRYQSAGWWKTVCLFQRLWWRQWQKR